MQRWVFFIQLALQAQKRPKHQARYGLTRVGGCLGRRGLILRRIHWRNLVLHLFEIKHDRLPVRKFANLRQVDEFEVQ